MNEILLSHKNLVLLLSFSLGTIAFQWFPFPDSTSGMFSLVIASLRSPIFAAVFEHVLHLCVTITACERAVKPPGLMSRAAPPEPVNISTGDKGGR